MNYKELQQWAQARGIRANQKKEILQRAWDKAQGLGKQTSIKGSYKKGFAAPGLDAVSSAGLPLTGEISTGRSAVQNRINRTTGVGGIPFGPLSTEDYLRGLPTDPASRKVRRRRDVPLSQGTPTPSSKYPYPHGPPRPPFGPPPPPSAGAAAGTSAAEAKGVKDLIKRAGKGGLKMGGPLFKFLIGPGMTMYMAYEILHGLGFLGGQGEKDRNTISAMAGMIPNMGYNFQQAGQKQRAGSELQQMGEWEDFARSKQTSRSSVQRGMNQDLDQIIANKNSVLAKASFSHPNIQTMVSGLAQQGLL